MIYFEFDHIAGSRPQIVRGGNFRLDDRGYTVSYHMKDAHALHYYSYHGRMRLGREEYVLSPGCVTLTPQGMASSYDLPEPGMHLCFHFRMPQGDGAVLPCFLPAGHVPANLHALLESALDTLRFRGMPGALRAAEEGLRLVLCRLYWWWDNEVRNGVAGRMGMVRDELDRTLEGPISVKALARKFNISQTHLSRGFKAVTGMTISEYRWHKRIEKARMLLQVSTLSIKEIGDAIGCSSPQEFNKRFRKAAGLPPSACRGLR